MEIGSPAAAAEHCRYAARSNMNLMQPLIDGVAAHLASMGIKLHCKLNGKATAGDIDTALKRLGIPLPASYVEFITQFSNGIELSWNADGASFASFEMATLESSIDGALGMRDWRFHDDEAARDYGFPYVDDSKLAVETNRQMHNWIPIHAEGNGDNFSINLNPDGFGNVIFDQHDWLDGGTGHNGYFMAPDLPTFIESWAAVCFSHPKSLWWKSVIGEDGVNWNSDEFDDRFRVNT
ncbi:MAG: SMI1/KNR4 family protein [Pirellulales bacterium]